MAKEGLIFLGTHLGFLYYLYEIQVAASIYVIMFNYSSHRVVQSHVRLFQDSDYWKSFIDLLPYRYHLLRSDLTISDLGSIRSMYNQSIESLWKADVIFERDILNRCSLGIPPPPLLLCWQSEYGPIISVGYACNRDEMGVVRLFQGQPVNALREYMLGARSRPLIPLPPMKLRYVAQDEPENEAGCNIKWEGNIRRVLST